MTLRGVTPMVVVGEVGVLTLRSRHSLASSDTTPIFQLKFDTLFNYFLFPLIDIDKNAQLGG